ncbi:carboxypeptidase-like regulatory domain-containing protein [uncultured Phocaeicola sp.]|uniref:carboxypeptidase-like regulatory domain-containing protein n=1 Tax=uncultured Phocaeicola sp. TaxID=990718 RepID=UPI0025A5A6D6|nr:carboxypeptidase-like regulatory domain-containing protein [uncultured Phocaeicola sp.]
MYNFVKRGVYMLLIAGLTMGATGCSDDDPDYENVTPPVVEVASNTLTGVITSLNGEGVSGAKVLLGADNSATTDANGVYLFKDVKAGTYQVKAEAEGKLPYEGTLTVVDEKKSQNLVWNAVLISDVKKEVTVSAEEASEGKVETEHLKGNDEAKVEVKAKIAAGAVEADTEEEVKVIISPLYKKEDVVARAARATDETMLVGASLSCNLEGVSLKKAIDLGFELDSELASKVEAKQYKNGEWVKVDSRIEDGRVIVVATEFASYGLFLGVEFSEQKSTEAVSFTQSKWDNLYGSKDMSVGEAAYTYKAGTEITTKGTSKLTALLVEKLAQRFGATVATVNGSYPINVTLPIGTMLEISGVQTKWSVSASAFGKSASGTRYGNVTVAVVTSNRQHTGGGN